MYETRRCKYSTSVERRSEKKKLTRETNQYAGRDHSVTMTLARSVTLFDIRDLGPAAFVEGCAFEVCAHYVRPNARFLTFNARILDGEVVLVILRENFGHLDFSGFEIGNPGNNTW